MDALKYFLRQNPWAVVVIVFIIMAGLVALEYIDLVAAKR